MSNCLLIVSVIVSVLVKTGLKDKLESLTLFAPTNEAFLKLEQMYLERLLDGQSVCRTSPFESHDKEHNLLVCHSRHSFYQECY